MTNQLLQVSEAIPKWRIAGDWIDVCSCNVPCPCTFAQPPTGRVCDVIFGYKIESGHFGATNMGGLNVVIIAGFTGSIWHGDKLDAGIFFDAAANPEQRQALELIFTGQAGGWMKQFISPILRNLKGIEFAKISIYVHESLEKWNVEIPKILRAEGKALTGPTADPTKRVQTINPPGSEVGPTAGVVTWGQSVESRWQAFGFSQNIPPGQNSKHIPFEWSGPDP